MKKYLAVLLLLMISITTSAQHKPFQFGFKFSGNIGWLGTDVEHYSNEGVKPGFSWGFIADFFLMENYSITTGFDMVFLNGKMSYPYKKTNEISFSEEEIINTFKTKYIQIPVVLTMKTNEINGLRYYGQIGAAIGFLIKAKEEGTYKDETIKNSSSDMFKLLRGSFVFGAGVEIPISGSTYVRTGLQFNNGFTNVLKGNNTVYPDTKNEARNHFLELNACIIF